MKYIEELKFGDAFEYNNIVYVLTSDFNRNNSRLCLSLIDGFPQWLSGETIVFKINLYKLDESNNFVAIKEHKNEYNIQA
jgi:hypothetical protein